jgi:hypothetical protein
VRPNATGSTSEPGVAEDLEEAALILEGVRVITTECLDDIVLLLWSKGAKRLRFLPDSYAKLRL